MVIHLLGENTDAVSRLEPILEQGGYAVDHTEELSGLNPDDLYLIDGGSLKSWREITVGRTELDPLTGILQCGENWVRLSVRECSLLRLLMQSEGRCIPKERLFLRVWGLDAKASINNLEAYIGILRRKLRQVDSDLQLQTIRWKGYRLVKLMNP